MSLVPKSLRIIAVPLTRPRLATPANAVQASRILTYYQFQISPTQPTERLPSSQESKLRWMPEGGLGKWITTKAAVTWAGFGKSKGWKLKIFQGGERLVDRLDFEELALKSIDPSLGPSITQTDMSHKRTEEIKTRIPLIYPPSINSGRVTLDELKALVAHRTPRHRKGFYLWMGLAPLTAPFIIIPYRSSQYLQGLLDSNIIVPEPSEPLDSVYIDFSPKNSADSPSEEKFSTAAPKTTSSQQHEVLLTRDAVPAILELFGLKPSASADLLRAVEQARVRVLSGRGVL